MPASIAPSTTSSPNRSAATSRRSSSRTIDQRSVVCAVARRPCWTRARILLSPRIRGSVVSRMATRPTARIDAIATNSPRRVRNSEMATIGKSSPTAPAASTYRPNSPESMSLSCRMGSSVPSAVVVRASPIGTKSWTKPSQPRMATAPTAMTALNAQPPMASRPARSRSRRGSSSYPASRNRKPSPTLASSLMLPVSARPRTCGPIRTPARISTTTWGTRGPGSAATMSGASAATSVTASSACRPSIPRSPHPERSQLPTFPEKPGKTPMCG